MFKLLLKIISVGLVLFIVAAISILLKEDVNRISEGMFMALYLAILIAALIFIRRNKIFRQFIYDRENSGHLPE